MTIEKYFQEMKESLADARKEVDHFRTVIAELLHAAEKAIAPANQPVGTVTFTEDGPKSTVMMDALAEPEPKPAPAPPKPAPQPAPQPKKVLVPTDKLKETGYTLEQFKEDPGWDDDLLVKEGYAVWEEVEAPKPAPAPEPVTKSLDDAIVQTVTGPLKKDEPVVIQAEAPKQITAAEMNEILMGIATKAPQNGQLIQNALKAKYKITGVLELAPHRYAEFLAHLTAEGLYVVEEG